MKTEGTGKLLRIFVGESDRCGHQPCYSAIVQAARRAGLRGASVFRGIEGYGGHSVVHAARILEISADLPVLIEIVDEEAKIRAFLPTIDDMIREGLVTLETVEIIAYRTGAPAAG